MNIRTIVMFCFLVLTTSCAAKYQSFTSGDGKPEDLMIQTAVADLVDSYAATGGSETIRLHTAKQDSLLGPVIEQRLRENGRSVVLVAPPAIFSGGAEQSEGIDMRYRASYFGNIGTYCLGIGETGNQIVCRMYEGAEPISSITTRGFNNKRSAKQIPVKDDSLLDDEVQMAKYYKPPSVSSSSESILGSIPTRMTESVILGRLAPPETDELSIIQTAHLDNDELRSVVQRYVAYLPRNSQPSFEAERRAGETEDMYRTRLLKQMKIVYSYQFHDGVGYE